jgi:hypothetical protein
MRALAIETARTLQAAMEIKDIPAAGALMQAVDIPRDQRERRASVAD